jgi:hypothetical protein
MLLKSLTPRRIVILVLIVVASFFLWATTEAQLFDPRPNEVAFRKAKRINRLDTIPRVDTVGHLGNITELTSHHVTIDTVMGITARPLGVDITGWLSNADWEKPLSYRQKQSVIIYLDTCDIAYSKEADPDKPTWSAWANTDTIIFKIPPKKLIIGHTTYTSMFLNGNWYFLMDPEPYPKYK